MRLSSQGSCGNLICIAFQSGFDKEYGKAFQICFMLELSLPLYYCKCASLIKIFQLKAYDDSILDFCVFHTLMCKNLD